MIVHSRYISIFTDGQLKLRMAILMSAYVFDEIWSVDKFHRSQKLPYDVRLLSLPRKSEI